jgi:hypothetical protein
VKAAVWLTCGDEMAAELSSLKLTWRRLWGVRAGWARRGPRGEDRMETCVKGRRGSGWYVAPQRCMCPRLKRLTGKVGDKYAEFMSLVVGRQ